MNNREKRIKRTIFALMILILLIITFSPWPPAVEAWNLNHWTTRDFPTIFSLLPPILGQPPKSECVSVFMCSRKQRFWGRRHSLFFSSCFYLTPLLEEGNTARKKQQSELVQKNQEMSIFKLYFLASQLIGLILTQAKDRILIRL